MARLEGKVAIVTGGARGMGAATVTLFAREGAKVVIADVLAQEGEALARELGAAAVFEKLDVGEEPNWREVVERTLARWGRIDVLVNNAAVITFGEITETDVADLERILRINLVGAFLGMKTVGKAMKAQKSGSIVNISSVDGMRGSNGVGCYAASKWGLRGLTKVAALEFGHHGVRVNSVHPGGINTVMGNPLGLPSSEINKTFAAVPLQRVGEPEEIAQVSLFLASDDASYVCGAELTADGGWLAGGYLPMLPGAPGAA